MTRFHPPSQIFTCYANPYRFFCEVVPQPLLSLWTPIVA